MAAHFFLEATDFIWKNSPFRKRGSGGIAMHKTVYQQITNAIFRATLIITKTILFKLLFSFN